ncbi:hypothetical protein KOR42_35360 [Thalassoglobus neptunius]|uniref:Uncharacterized protein n=1 Tax=Thalassoglobus neptunius TaxID=1938619 RepID=A0A5C5WLD5_9PLAN|nr:hypothetical protein [Thalassoglobus neptunius]TWT51488.1 hypothetical protein KOR42_35360 [Thalassoglobus neptunius]
MEDVGGKLIFLSWLLLGVYAAYSFFCRDRKRGRVLLALWLAVGLMGVYAIVVGETIREHRQKHQMKQSFNTIMTEVSNPSDSLLDKRL